jgi:uncharacterized protein YqeY
MIKQRNDSIEMFEKANRQELVEKEQGEIKIISEFLPSSTRRVTNNKSL